MPEVYRSTAVVPPTPRDVPASLSPRDDRWLQDEIDIADYAGRFRRHWKLLIASALLGAVIGLAIAQFQTTLYEAVTTLLVVTPPKTPASPANITNFRALIENGTLVSQTIEELQLNRPPHDLTVQTFLDRALITEEVRGSTLLRVRVRLRDPKLAAEASRRLSDKAIALDRQLRREEGAAQSEQLKSHLDRAAEQLKTAEQELLAFQRKGQVELLKEDTTAMLGERGTLLKLIIDIEGEKARLAAAEAEIKKQEPVLSVARSVRAEEALRRAAPSQSEGDTATTRTPGGARRDGAAAREPAVNPEALDLSNPIVNPVYQTLDYQIVTSRARLASLERQRREMVEVRGIGADQLKPLTELYARQIDLARYQNNYDLAKRVYSELAVRYEQSRAESVEERARLQMVDAAMPPERPLSRHRAQAGALGFATGLFASALAALYLTNPKLRER
jgi:uncharacterized protein involved in exopolysaccharide biosynthesis